MNLYKTIGFGVVQLAATILISLWCQTVHSHFLQEHPNGYGAALSNFYWNFSWIGIAASAIFMGFLILFSFKNWRNLYEIVFYIAILSLVVWFGVALIAMEVSFIGWSDLRGIHF